MPILASNAKADRMKIRRLSSVFLGVTDPRFLDQCADLLDRGWQEKKAEVRAASNDFDAKMETRWGPAFESFEKLLYFYVDIAEVFSRQCKSEDGSWSISIGDPGAPESGWLNQVLNVTNMREQETDLRHELEPPWQS